MKTARKALLIALCCVLLVAASVLGTLAYLTDSEAVTNTFTVGKVGITLDEADVDNSTADKDRDTANAYHLLPGGEYDKDPIVHVDSTSEDAWIFVKVENGIAAIEAEDNNVDAQIKNNGWTVLNGVSGVYYKQALKSEADKDLEVFQKITIAEGVNNTTLEAYEGKTIVVTAYAIQLAGFENNVAGAWQAVSAAAKAQG